MHLNSPAGLPVAVTVRRSRPGGALPGVQSGPVSESLAAQWSQVHDERRGGRPFYLLVHIMVDLICIEISMVNDLLYKVFHYSCVDIVLTDVLLNNAFALGEDVGSIHVQWWHVFCLYCLLHRPGRNHHRRLHWNALQRQLNVSCVDAPWNEFQKSSKNLSVSIQI